MTACNSGEVDVVPRKAPSSLVQMHGEIVNRFGVTVLFIENLTYPCYIMHSMLWSYS